MNFVGTFARALGWVNSHSLSEGGVAVNSRLRVPYPEVSGYFIPTLLAWNEKDLATRYGSWLVATQHEAGYWTDPSGQTPCIFDVGQIVRGLLALAQATNDQKWVIPLRKAVKWALSHVDDAGHIQSPDEAVWNGAVPLGVLLYALEPMRRASLFLDEPELVDRIDSCVSWFLKDPALTDFTTLSHFHAYIMEALFDLGHVDRCRQGMALAAALQKSNGAVPAYRDVSWTCSTGLFQYAIVWYKLGEVERAHRAFRHAVSLQNRSGGWYGSYGGLTRILPNRFGLGRYFAREEISWAVKYFMDAMLLMLRARFDEFAPIFIEHIDADDGRYLLVRELAGQNGVHDVLDVGCGKGRYLRRLSVDCPDACLHGVDLSTKVMECIPSVVHKAQGSLLSLPYSDASFDFVFSSEALEHCVHLDGALRELLRVVRPGGTLLVIDKNVQRLGRLRICEWEQWFDGNDLSRRLEGLGCTVRFKGNVPYEGKADGLFGAWIAKRQ